MLFYRLYSEFLETLLKAQILWRFLFLGTAINQMAARRILCVTTQAPMFGDSCICLIVWSLFILGNDHLNSRIAYKVDTSCNILPACMSSWDGQVRPKGSSILPNTQWAKRIGMSGAFLLGEMSLSWILDWLLQFCAAIHKSGDNWVYPHS